MNQSYENVSSLSQVVVSLFLYFLYFIFIRLFTFIFFDIVVWCCYFSFDNLSAFSKVVNGDS